MMEHVTPDIVVVSCLLVVVNDVLIGVAEHIGVVLALLQASCFGHVSFLLI